MDYRFTKKGVDYKIVDTPWPEDYLTTVGERVVEIFRVDNDEHFDGFVLSDLPIGDEAQIEAYLIITDYKYDAD